MGYVIDGAGGRELIWTGARCEPQADAAIDTYEDHRMALAFAPLALKLGRIAINAPHVVTKSYPHYWDDQRRIGFGITAADAG